MADFDDSTIARFWSKVDKDGPVPAHTPHLRECWVWTGAKDAGGYGMIRIGGRRGRGYRAHRISFIIAGHRPSPEVPCVLHHCDNPSCVNPKHLWLGTKAQNNEDKVRKHRQARGASLADAVRAKTPRGDRHHFRLHPERAARGERNANAKLTAPQVRLIRERFAAGVFERLIAAEFCVARTTISKIKRGLSWRHVT